MGYRTLEINKPSEIHIRKGQLEIAQEEGAVQVAIEDTESIILAGPDIRISSNALAMLAGSGVMVVCCNRSNMPAGFFMPTEPNSRQALLARHQIEMTSKLKKALWRSIIKRKIENQARVLSILGKDGVSEVAAYVTKVKPGDPDNAEGAAARIYFPFLHEGLNRRSTDPFNSVLNYGYAILRSTIVKNIVSTGLIACFGIHHESQLNNFNLADDLIEPFRPMVDLVAPSLVTTSEWLSKEQRHELVGVLHHACLMDGRETTVLKAIAQMVDSLRRSIEDSDPSNLVLPTVVEVKELSEVVE